MRHEMQCAEDELFTLREERAQADMERAAAADEADAASAALAAAEKRQADLVAAIDEVTACHFAPGHVRIIRSKEASSLGSLPLVGALFKFIRWTELDVIANDSIPVLFEFAG